MTDDIIVKIIYIMMMIIIIKLNIKHKTIICYIEIVYVFYILFIAGHKNFMVMINYDHI